ncbi:MAG: hypothetical protein GY726_12305 [Proteobacteria bacterium]|nr:hypothetical protein [Pseudomonadota bacterium]
MRDQPQGADLLAEARQVLSESVLPELTSKARFNVLMALRAMELAERELRADPEQESRLNERLSQLVVSGDAAQNRFSVLSKSIRDGDFDASDEAHIFLQQVTAFKLKEMGSSKLSEELESLLNQLS